MHLFRAVAEEVRHHLAFLGATSLEEVIGRADLLRPIRYQEGLGAGLERLLVNVKARNRHPGFQDVERSAVGDAIALDWVDALAGSGQPGPVEISYPVTNRDRTVGTRLSGAVTERFGADLDDDTIQVRLSGIAGQSLGAFLSRGITLRLDGTANDYVGKGQGGGRIIVVPRLRDGQPAHGAGNAVLYGATGGSTFIAGEVGQRFAVRNSGATGVIEGCSDHGCEYMTGGTAVILGRTGRNLAAGMTGGVLFVYDPEMTTARVMAETAPPKRRLDGDDEKEALRSLIDEHHRLTSSDRAAAILRAWTESSALFWVIEGTAVPLQDLEAGSEGEDELEEALDG